MSLLNLAELRDKEYRHGLVNSQIEVDLPLQIRALRRQHVGTQPELATLTGMKQPRISAMEKPGEVHFTLETLRRLAYAFDVALIVRFAPFSELNDWAGNFNPDSFCVPNFDQEIEAEEQTPMAALRALGVKDLKEERTTYSVRFVSNEGSSVSMPVRNDKLASIESNASFCSVERMGVRSQTHMHVEMKSAQRY